MSASMASAAALGATAINSSSAAVTPAHARMADAPCLVPGVGKPLDQIWRPKILAAIHYQRRRHGEIAFAVRTAAALYGNRCSTR